MSYYNSACRRRGTDLKEMQGPSLQISETLQSGRSVARVKWRGCRVTTQHLGEHITIICLFITICFSDGTVNRTICVTEFEGDCHFKMNGQVRTCPSSDNRGETFFVYFLTQPSVGCHWAYCAYNEEDVDI